LWKPESPPFAFNLSARGLKLPAIRYNYYPWQSQPGRKEEQFKLEKIFYSKPEKNVVSQNSFQIQPSEDEDQLQYEDEEE
jgi:hypothetical protein